MKLFRVSCDPEEGYEKGKEGDTPRTGGHKRPGGGFEKGVFQEI